MAVLKPRAGEASWVTVPVNTNSDCPTAWQGGGSGEQLHENAGKLTNETDSDAVNNSRMVL